MKKLLLFLILFIASFINTTDHRQLIVLNETGDNENINLSLNNCKSLSCAPVGIGAISTILMTAMHQQAAPIFSSKGLWHSFCDHINTVDDFIKKDVDQLHKKYGKFKKFNNNKEKIKEFKQQLLFFNNFYLKINKILSETTQQEKIKELLSKDSFFQIKNCPKAVQNTNFDIIQEVWTYILCYNIPINQYTVINYDNGYLFIPQNHIKAIKFSNSNQIENPIKFKSKNNKKGSFQENLFSLLKNSKHKWTICVAGHGCYYQETIHKLANRLICGFTVNQWKKFINKLNNEISTHLLFYISCSGGGKNSIDPYKSQNIDQKLKFPILTVALTEAEIDIQQEIPIDIYKKFISWHSNGIDKKIEPKTYLDFRSFFKNAEKANCQKDFEKCLNSISIWLYKPDCNKNTCGFINKNFLSNIPMIRLPGEVIFKIPKLVKEVFSITKNAKETKVNPADKLACLLEANNINSIEIEKANGPHPAFVSMLPGTATHKISNLNASAFKLSEIIESFFPFEKLFSTKIFFIKNIKALNGNFKNVFFLNNIKDTDETQINAVIFFADNRWHFSAWDFEEEFPKNILTTFEPIEPEELHDLFKINNLNFNSFIK